MASPCVTCFWAVNAATSDEVSVVGSTICWAERLPSVSRQEASPAPSTPTCGQLCWVCKVAVSLSEATL